MNAAIPPIVRSIPPSRMVAAQALRANGKRSRIQHMISDQTGRELHDRATRGMPFSAQDQAQLQEWYEQQDQCESATLVRAAPPADLVRIRHDVNAALVQLQSVAQRIQALTSENEILKQEIAALQRQLKNAQPA